MYICRLSIWYNEVKVFEGNTFIIMKYKFCIGYQFGGFGYQFVGLSICRVINLLGYQFVGYQFVGYQFVGYQFVGYQM